MSEVNMEDHDAAAADAPGAVVAEVDEDSEEADAVPDRMAISENERNLALNIKTAIEATPHVDPVSDFMCVQLALMDGDDTETAVQRAHQLQCFREEYGILDTAKDGQRIFAQTVDLFPNFHLCLANYQEMGKSVLVYDYSKFDAAKIQSEDKMRLWLRGCYYTCALVCPDFEVVRQGCVLVAECEGYNWKKDLDFKSLRRVWSELATVYPLKFQKIKYFNAGTTMNLVVSMLKPFLPKYMHSRMEFGCQFHERLDSIYLVPTEEEAKVRLLKRAQHTLQVRFDNEAAFQL